MIAAVALFAATTPAAAKYAGETYTCDFSKSGRIVINTREPGSTIRWHGKVYPAQGGSYFYTADDAKILVLFQANMKRWNFGDGDDEAACSHRGIDGCNA